MDYFVDDLLEEDRDKAFRLYRNHSGGLLTVYNDGNAGQVYVLLPDGPRYVPRPVTCAAYQQRSQLEPGAARQFRALAMEWIDRVHTPDFAFNAVKQAIEMCDMTTNPASQRIYRIGIAEPLSQNRSPDFVSVRAIYCFSFGIVQETLRNRLRNVGEEWMFDKTLQYNEAGNAVRRQGAGAGPYAPVLRPVLKCIQHGRASRKLPDRPPPIYTVYEDGSIAVGHTFMPGLRFPATMEEMVGCEDRVQYRKVSPDRLELEFHGGAYIQQVAETPTRGDEPREIRPRRYLHVTIMAVIIIIAFYMSLLTA